jgi:hypothetical protein
MEAKTYRTRPVEVEAMEYVEGREGCLEILKWMVRYGVDAYSTSDGAIHIPTHPGSLRLMPRDYLVRDIAGYFQPIEANMFRSTYDEVQPEQSLADSAADLHIEDSSGWKPEDSPFETPGIMEGYPVPKGGLL